MPDRINTSPCLQRYLDALPRSEYFGKGYQVEATDGLSWLNRSSTKEPAMGAGVMWHDAAIPHRSERVGGQHSSTRAELAAVVIALLQWTPRADDLAILIDSAAAIQRLRWFWSHDFPTGRAQGQGLWHHPWHFTWTQVAIRLILPNSFCKSPWSFWRPTPRRGGQTSSRRSRQRKWQQKHFISRRPGPRDGFQLGW